VVNHSEGFATADQVDSNPEVSQVPVSGLIHSNMIESMWTQLKDYVKRRHRTYKEAPGKILEHLWLIENHGDVMGGLYRMFREVKFPSNRQQLDNVDEDNEEEDGDQPMFFTQAPNGENSREQAIRIERDRRHFEAWIARRRAERVEALGNQDEEDTTDDEEEVNTRINAPLRNNRNNVGTSSPRIESDTPNTRRRGRPSTVARGRGRPRTRNV
jgi:hypothetical protein